MPQNVINTNPLTPAVFHILLALSTKERHGYDIMNQVKESSEGNVPIGPGTLYGSLKRMMNDELVEEVASRSEQRRIYYRLTPKGKKAVGYELKRYQGVIKFAKEKGLARFFALQ